MVTLANGATVGFQLPDLVVLEYLRHGVAVVQRNPDLLTEALVRFDDDYMRQLKDTLTRGAADGHFLPVFAGWPMQAAQVPGFGVTLLPEQEDSSRQPIGQIGSQPDGAGGVDEIFGTFLRSSIQVACYGTTQRGALLMGLLAKWVVLQSNEQLLDEGLQEITISLTSATPLQDEFLPDWFFCYNLTITCSYLDSWSKKLYPVISEVEVSLYPNEQVTL